MRDIKKPYNTIVWFALTTTTLFVTVLIFVLASPKHPNIQSRLISPDTVTVLPHEGSGPFRRKRAGENEYDLYTARHIPNEIKRQYTYKFELAELPAIGGDVFIPEIGGSAIAYLNGVRMGDTKETPSFTPGHSRHYLHAAPPRSSYQIGINRLIVVMTPDNSFTGLPAIYMGQTGDFSMAAQSLSARSNGFSSLTLFLSALLILIAILGLLQRTLPKYYIPLLGLGSASAIFTLLCRPDGNDLFLTDHNGWAACLYMVSAFFICLLLARSPIKHRPVLFGLGVAAIFSILVGIAMLLPIVWPFYASNFAYFSAAGTLPFGLIFGLYGLAHQRQLTKVSQKTLQETVAKQEALIEAQKKAIEDGLKAKGRLEERQRLTRDIHDGIGGHLLSLLVRVRDGDMSQAEIEDDLQYGLNDLRLIVDSMDHSDGTLDAAFVTFRTRANAQLRAAGITLKWTQTEPFIPTYLGPAAILNLYRLMQEAITNAIRHAQCNTLAVMVSRKTELDDLTISIEDNGIGFQNDTPLKAGQGVKNMQYRAKSLGASLSFTHPRQGGTRIDLLIPPEKENRDAS